MSSMAAEKLTNREIDVCKSFVSNKGNTNAIGADLTMQPCTVRTHLTSIYLKLMVNSKVELMHYLLI